MAVAATATDDHNRRINDEDMLIDRISERDRCADRLRNKYRERYMAWCRDSVSSDPPGVALLTVEAVPSCTGWVNVPHQHPYNTTYFPFQRNPEFFYPRGMRFVDVSRIVIVDPALAPPELIQT
ncbi:hypothetical protein PInf_022630 [Phytophthora infestans]|nr:hypothetical protein PInf_022630 [Phytophthora infestans]